MIRKKGMLIFKNFLILTALCLAAPSAADVKNCVWCEKKDAEGFMKCITRRLAIIPNFKNSISSLNEMKTTLLEAADAIKMKGPTKDNAMKGALTYALSELISTENYDQTIKDVIYILQRCYRVINKIPDQIFLDELAKTVKIIIEENKKMLNAQQPVDQTKPGEISEIGPLQNNANPQQLPVGPLQDNATPQQLPVGPLQDATPQQLPDGPLQDNATPQQLPVGQLQDNATPQQLSVGPLPNLGSAYPFAFSAANSYAATYQQISKQQPDSPNNGFLLNAQPNTPLNPPNIYNQHYPDPTNLAKNKNYPQQSVITNTGKNNQLFGKNLDYYPQNKNPNIYNLQYLKDKYPENQPGSRNTAANADAPVYTYNNGPQNNNGYYPSYLGSSASATSEAIYYGPQNNNGYNPNKADTSAVPIANAPTQLSKDNGNNVAASKSFAIDKYPDNNQKQFQYPSDNFNLKFPPKSSDKTNKRNRNANLFIPKSIPQLNTNPKDILSEKDDKTAKALKFSQTLFIVLKDAISFKKVYHEYTRNDQVLIITPYILYDALYTCGYPENIAQILAHTSISFMKSFPEGSPTPSYAEAFCKMIMVLFNSNDLIGDNPDTQAKELGNALLISLKKIENSLQNNNTQLNVLPETKQIKDAIVPLVIQKINDNQPEKLETKTFLIDKPSPKYNDKDNSDYSIDVDYSGQEKILKNKLNKKDIKSYPDTSDILDGYEESEYIGDDNKDDYDDGYSTDTSDDGYDDTYDDDDDDYSDDDFDDYDDGSDDINPDDYLTLPTKKENKQTILQKKLNYDIDNNKNIDQVPSEQPNYFIADEQQKSKSLDDEQKTINTAPVNDFMQKPDKQTDLIKNDVPVIDDLQNLIPKKNINVPNKNQSKDRVKILMKYGLDCMKDGKFDYKTFSNVIASLAKFIQKTNPDWGPQKCQTTVLIEAIFALTQLLLKSNIKGIKDTLQQPQTIVQPANKLLNNQINYQKNDLNTDYQIPQKNENLQPVVQSNPLNQPAVDYLVPKENIVYPPQNQIQNNQWGNDYDTNQNPYSVIQDAPISQVEPIYTNSAPQQVISTIPQNQVKNSNWNSGSQPWQSNENSVSQIKNSNANSQQFMQQNPGQINPKRRKWNANEQSFANSQIVNSNLGIPNANNLPNFFDNQGNLPLFQQNGGNSPGMIQNGNQGNWGYPQNIANIPSLVQSGGDPAFTGIPGAPLIPNDSNNPNLAQPGNPGFLGIQSDSAPVIPNDINNPNLLQNGPQGNWALPQQNGMNTQNFMQTGNQGFFGSQGNSVPLIPNDQSNQNLLQNRPEGNWPLSQANGMNNQNSMQTGSQDFTGFQGNSGPLIPNDQSNPNFVQTVQQGNWPFSQQNGMNSENLQLGNQGTGVVSPIGNSQQNQFPQNSFSPQRNLRNWG